MKNLRLIKNLDMTNEQILLLIGLVDQHRDTPFFPDGTPWGSAVTNEYLELSELLHNAFDDD
jgi:hypothetical protein